MSRLGRYVEAIITGDNDNLPQPRSECERDFYEAAMKERSEGGGATSWSDLGETTVYSDTLTWDGKKDALYLVDMSGDGSTVFCQVSSSTPIVTSGTLQVFMFGEESTIPFDESNIMPAAQGANILMVDDFPLVAIISDEAVGVDVDGLVFGRKGIYFINAPQALTYVASLAIDNYNDKFETPRITPIPHKYIDILESVKGNSLLKEKHLPRIRWDNLDDVPFGIYYPSETALIDNQSYALDQYGMATLPISVNQGKAYKIVINSTEYIAFPKLQESSPSYSIEVKDETGACKIREVRRSNRTIVDITNAHFANQTVTLSVYEYKVNALQEPYTNRKTNIYLTLANDTYLYTKLGTKLTLSELYADMFNNSPTYIVDDYSAANVSDYYIPVKIGYNGLKGYGWADINVDGTIKRYCTAEYTG